MLANIFIARRLSILNDLNPILLLGVGGASFDCPYDIVGPHSSGGARGGQEGATAPLSEEISGFLLEEIWQNNVTKTAFFYPFQPPPIGSSYPLRRKISDATPASK